MSYAETMFNEAAWASFMMFAWEDAGTLAAFTEATGLRKMPMAKSPLEAMIDDATGANRNVAEAFIAWASEEMWGLDDTPVRVREMIERRKASPERAGE